MHEELSIRAIDYILYNRRPWREWLELMDTQTSRSVVRLPLPHSPGDPVGRAAVTRASVSQVLDVVDAALKGLPKEHRRIAVLKWEELRTHNETADSLNYSIKTIERRVRDIREIVKAYLEAMDEGTLKDFWRGIDGIG